MKTALALASLLLATGCGEVIPPPEWLPIPGNGGTLDGVAADAPTEADGRLLVETAARVLAGERDALDDLPDRLRGAGSRRFITLSASDRSSPAWISSGSGPSWSAALRSAALALERLAPQLRGEPFWLKLDALLPGDRLIASHDRLPSDFNRSLEGLVFEALPEHPLLPEELVSRDLVDDRARLDMAAVRRYLESHRTGTRVLTKARKREATGRSWLLRRFSTRGFFFDGQRSFALYRGHRQPPPLTTEVLLGAARRGGAYLSRATRENGRFVYIYDPTRDRAPRDYNMVRHAGTIYSMLDLYRTTGDSDVLEASERAIGHMLESIVPWGEPTSRTAALAYGGKIKLGGVALAAIALAEHVEAAGSREHLETAQRLCRYLVASQRDSGEFIYQRYHPDGRVRTDFVSEYYPGEAILALTRIHALDRDPAWIDTAERAADFLINVRDSDRAIHELAHDHWLLYALDRLHRARPRPIYLTHARRIVTAILRSETRVSVFPDHVGSHGFPPRSTPTATRSEGLLAAYLLMRSFGDPDMAAEVLEVVKRAIAFQLPTQMTPERALYLARPERALGGFSKSLDDLEIRIDYVQHNLSALLHLGRTLATRSGPGR